MTTVAIIVVAVFFLGMGVYALVAPAALVRPFRITVDEPESRSEIRAVYGGFGIAVAVMLAVAAFGGAGIRHGVALTIAAALTGMAAGRLLSRLVDRRTRFYPIWLYFWVEALAGGLLFVAA